MGSDLYADNFVFDPDNGATYDSAYPYLLEIQGSSISDVNTGTIIEDSSIAYDPENGYIYVVDYQNNLQVYNPNSGNAHVATIGGLAGEYQVSMVYDPSDGNLYDFGYTCGSGCTVYMSQISPHLDSVVATQTLPGLFNVNQVGYDPLNGYLYVPAAGQVLVYNGMSYVTTITNSGFSDPNQAVFVPSTGEMWFSDFGGGASVVSGTSYVAHLTFPNGYFGLEMAYDPTTGYLYYPLYYPGNELAVINPLTLHTVNVFSSGNLDYGAEIVYDPENARLLVADAEGNNGITPINIASSTTASPPATALVGESIYVQAPLTSNGSGELTTTLQSAPAGLTCSPIPAGRTEVDGSCQANAQGTYTLYYNVTDRNSNTLALTMTLTVGGITLGTSSGTVGSSVTVSGSGFADSSTLTFLWQGNGASSLTPFGGSCTTDGTGTITPGCTFGVPASPVGPSQFWITDGTDTTFAPFTVLSSLSVAPSSGTPGIEAWANGTGFAGSGASSNVAWSFGPQNVCSGISDQANGNVTCEFTVPATPTGTVTVSATDSSSNSASTTFAVVAGVSASPFSGPVGTSIAFSGSGFLASTPLVTTWGGSAFGSPSCPATTDSTGSFQCTAFVLPDTPAGSYTFSASDGSSSPSTTFTVMPQIQVPSTSGYVGGTVWVSATGFAANSGLTIELGGTPVSCLPSSTTGADGSLPTCAFSAPDLAAGNYPIFAEDSSSNTAPTVSYTLLPPQIISNASAGHVGTSIAFSGLGFYPGSTVTITWTDSTSTLQTACTQIANASGDVTCSIYVLTPTAGGSYTFTGTDGVNSATLTFDVVSQIFSDPTYGGTSDPVGVQGTGFGSGVTVTVVLQGGGTICSATSAANGSFQCYGDLPAAPGGLVYLAAFDGTFSAETPFDFLASLSLGGPSGTVGSDVVASGTGFASDGTVTVTIDGDTVCSVSADAGGNWTCTDPVPQVPGGNEPVVASDGTNTALGVFDVLASLEAIPGSGPVGTSVELEAQGYSATDAITITWTPDWATGPILACSGTTDANGAFVCYYTIPGTTSGSYPFLATDVGGGSSTTTFTVVSGLVLSAGDQTVGGTLTVQGTGFSADAPFQAWLTGWGWICSGTTDSGGNVTCTGVVPYAPDNVVQTVTGGDGLYVATTGLTIDPVFSFLPGSVAVGGTVEISGSGLFANDSYTVMWIYDEPCAGTTNATGTFSCTYTMPPAASFQSYIVTYLDDGNDLTQAFTVTASLYEGATSATVGSTVTFNGTGFLADTAVTVTSARGVTCSDVTDARGGFNCVYTVPPTYAGSWTFTASDGTNSLTISLLIISDLTVTPGSGIVGSTVVVTGTGYGLSTSFTVYLLTPGNPYACQGTTDANGGFNCTWVIPPEPANLYAFVGEDGDGNVVLADFFILPSLTTTTTSGTVFSTITYVGNGWAPSAVLTIDDWFSGESFYTPCLVYTNTTGSFTCTWQVAYSDAGSHTVDVGDGHNSLFGVAPFEVLPSLVLVPTSGPVGTTLSIEGLGWGDEDTVQVTWGASDTSICGTGASTNGTGTFFCPLFTVPPTTEGAVLLTGSDAVADGSLSATTTFTVTTTLVVGLSGDPDPTDVGVLVELTALPSGGQGPYVSYSWNFGDGSTLTTSSAVVWHLYDTAGTYTVTVEVTDSYGSTAWATFPVIVLADPSVVLTITPSSTDSNVLATFTATASGGTGGTTYTWMGLPAACGSPIGSTFTCVSAAPGSYDVSVMVQDTAGVTGVSATVVFVVDASLSASANSLTTSLDLGQTTLFSVTASGGTGTLVYTWSNLPAGCAAGDVASFVCAPTAAGSTTATVLVVDSVGGSFSLTFSAVTVYGHPTIGLSGTYASLDLTQTTQLTATASGGLSTGATYSYTGVPAGCTASGASFSCTPMFPGTYLVTVDYVDGNGYSVSATTALTVLADPTATDEASSSVVDLGQGTTLTASAEGGAGGFSYVWSGLPTGCSASDHPSLDCVSTATGTFSIGLVVTDANGFSITLPSVSLDVLVDPSVAAPTAVHTSLDVGQTLTLTSAPSGGSGTYTIEWGGLPGGCTSVSAKVLSCTPTAPGTYAITVSITDGLGASSTSPALTVTVSSDPSVLAPVPSVPSADVSQTVVFSATASGGPGLLAYQWFGLPSGCSFTLTTASCSMAAAGTLNIAVTVSDTNGGSATSATLSFSVFSDPTVALGASTTAIDLTQQVVLTATSAGGAGGETFVWHGLPTGCSSTNVAVLTCLPTATGSATVSVTATDANGYSVLSATTTFVTSPDPSVGAPVATPASLDAGQTTVLTVTPSGGTGSLTLVWSGLPIGCSSSDSASLSCTPTVAGSSSVQVTLTDAVGFAVVGATLSLTVLASPSVAAPTANVSSADVGQLVQFTAVASGGTGAYTYLWSGLPSGCASSLATFSCTVLATGVSSIAVRVTDGNGAVASSAPLAFSVLSDPSVAASASPATFDLGQTTGLTATATGGAGSFTYLWSGLPAGCASTSTATLSCAPTASGSFSISVRATDANGFGVTSSIVSIHAFVDPVAGGVSLSSGAADVGQTVTISLAPTGGLAPYSYVWSGLPAGCVGTDSARLICAPSSAGSSTITATITDAAGLSSTSTTAVLVVSSDPSLGTPVPSPSSVEVDQTISLSVALTGGSGGAVYSWTGLPSGCLSANTADLSCTPLAAGSYGVQAHVRDSNGANVSSSALLIVVDAALASATVSASALELDVGQSTTLSLAIVGGLGPYSIVWSGLPTGCVSASEATITCAPSVAGSYSVAATVSDALGATVASTAVTLGVTPALTTSAPGASSGSIDLGQKVTWNVSAGGGRGPLSFAWTGLPAGCSTTDASQLTCAPTATGTFSVAVTVSDANGMTVTSTTISLAVASALATPTLTASVTTFDLGTVVLLGVAESGGSGGYQYAWQGLGPAGCDSASSAELSCAPTTSGNFSLSVIVSDSNGASATSAAVVLAVDRALGVALTSDASVVPSGRTINFTASAYGGNGEYSYAWYVNGSLVPSASGPTYALHVAGGSYVVAVSVWDGTAAGTSRTSSPSLQVQGVLESWQQPAASSTSSSALSGSGALLAAILGLLVLLIVLMLVALLYIRRRGGGGPSGSGAAAATSAAASRRRTPAEKDEEAPASPVPPAKGTPSTFTEDEGSTDAAPSTDPSEYSEGAP